MVDFDFTRAVWWVETHKFFAHRTSGISTKTLTQRLRELEAQGIIDRHVYAEVPPHVEYSLTTKGRQIQPVMAALHKVGSNGSTKQVASAH